MYVCECLFVCNVCCAYVCTLIKPCSLFSKDPCDPDPCVNGECVQDSVDYSCTCTMDYTGVNCETLIPSCVLGPCKNGGSCTAVSQEEYVCHCGPGYTGENCTEEIDPCVGVECGSGTCVSNGANVYCMCSPGFTGETCGEIIGRCCVCVPVCL